MTFLARALFATAITLGVAYGNAAARSEPAAPTAGHWSTEERQQIAILAKRYGDYAESVYALRDLFSSADRDGCLTYGVRPYQRWTRKDIGKILHPTDPRIVAGYGLIGYMAEAAHKSREGNQFAQNFADDFLTPRLTEILLSFDVKALSGPNAGANSAH